MRIGTARENLNGTTYRSLVVDTGTDLGVLVALPDFRWSCGNMSRHAPPSEDWLARQVADPNGLLDPKRIPAERIRQAVATSGGAQ